MKRPLCPGCRSYKVFASPEQEARNQWECICGLVFSEVCGIPLIEVEGLKTAMLVDFSGPYPKVLGKFTDA